MESEEYIDILNTDGSPTGKTCLKSEIHVHGYYHNTAHVWYFNSKAEILLAQRSVYKTIYPLLWDISVAGHVDAGETVEQAAIRETKEEIGIDILESSLEKIGVFDCFQSYDNGIIDNEFHHTFISQINYALEDLKLDLKEVAQVKFVSISEFLELLGKSALNNHFVASNRDYYLNVIGAIKDKFV